MKKVLVVVDMQEDFVRGALGSKDAEAIVENVKEKINLYRKNSDIVVFTRDTHAVNYMNTLEGKNLPTPHCIKGTDGWQIIPELDVADSIVIDKSTFGSYDLVEFIASLDDIESIECMGLCTSICVISNTIMLKTAFREIPITVDASCCACVTPESHKHALEAMKMCQINVVGE